MHAVDIDDFWMQLQFDPPRLAWIDQEPIIVRIFYEQKNFIILI